MEPANEIYTTLACSPELIVESLLPTDRRVLLFGESGVGKSTLAAGLGLALELADRPCTIVGADPGSPAFGIPGAVCLAGWRKGGWRLLDFEALCTLDAGRFRLPLVSAVGRLSQRVRQGMLLVDAPGIVRSVAGAELLIGIVEAAAIDAILVLARDNQKLPLAHELATLSCKIIRVQPSYKARRPSQRKRIRLRTCLWDQYLQHADDRTISLFDTPVTGTPPPIGADREWQGRQIALLKSGRTLAMGEVRKVRKNVLHVSIADFSEAHDQILIRDAYRNTKGLLATAKLVGASTIHYIPPDIAPYPGPGGNTGPRPIVKFGEATAFLINGIFGDPLLHIRMHNQKRSILFDLGEGGRLPARLAHQVTDVFISHAHIDHISGFLWLMRSRIGRFPSCRLFGPPGLTGHIAGMMAGIHWDRIGEWGPIFEVGELHGQYLIVHKLQAGKECREQIDERPVPDGLLLKDSACEVQALTLDHGAIPVLSYCLKQTPKLNVRKDRLIARNLAPGPWLGELKKQIVMGKRQTVIQLPDGHSGTVGNLADELILITPAQKMVYATDIDDNKGNREKLTMLAKGADIFFCEAAFIEADREKAKRSGHLTARGCGEIAQVAGAERLVPFHFSRRYERNPLRVYDEIRSSNHRVVVPKFSTFQQSAVPHRRCLSESVHQLFVKRRSGQD